MTTQQSTPTMVVKLRKPAFPTKSKRHLLYYDNPSINPGAAGAAATHVFSCNGLYDPNITGTGHQPLGFDQLTPLYDKYTVIGAKITITFANTDSTYAQFGGVFITRNSATEIDPTKIIENGKGKYVRLGPAGLDSSQATITMTCPVAKFLGISKILSEDDCSGDSTSNPAQECYFHVWAAPGISVDAAPVNLNVLIEYIAVFTEPKLLATS